MGIKQTVDIGRSKKHNGGMHKGQALLMILLVMGVAITIGLSVASRSVTEVNLSGTEEQSARALQAAEAGVEKALGGVETSGTNVSVGPNSTYNSNTTSLTKSTNPGGFNTNSYRVPYPLDAGDVATINLTNPDGSGYTGGFTICWGAAGENPIPAIEVILYFRRQGYGVVVGRGGYDGDINRNINNTVDGNGFEVPSGPKNGQDCNGYSYAYAQQFNFPGNRILGFDQPGDEGLFMRVRMLYNGSSDLLVIDPQGNGGGTTLPVQGKEIVSTGVSGDTAQKVHVVQPNADLPFMFDSALFSGGKLDQ